MFTGRTEFLTLWAPDAKSQLAGKDPDAGKDWGQEEKWATEDEMAGWHHWLKGHEFEQTQGDGKGQGSLASCSSWGCKESDTAQWLNKNNKWLKLRQLTILSVEEEKSNWNHRTLLLGMTMIQLLEKKRLADSCKIKHILPTQSINPILMYLSKKNKNICPRKELNLYIPRSSTHNGKGWKLSKFHKWMNKLWYVY